MSSENSISTTKNALYILGHVEETPELLALKERFLGDVIALNDDMLIAAPEHICVYVCGDVNLLDKVPASTAKLRVIQELSYHMDARPDHVEVVTLGQVPLLVHGVGVLFPRFFEQQDLFHKIQEEHEFQQLTESTKASKALRTGIYLTHVDCIAVSETDTDYGDFEEYHFRLLRCSSNLTGPTDNFRTTDHMIMKAINEAAHETFERETSLNHVLAQIYVNEKQDDERGRERKARIGAHSDKTKDMREDGLLAFCTFYNANEFSKLTPSNTDPYDFCYKQTSGLTTLHFKLKPEVQDTTLVQEFSVTLYPNSVFIIPLSTNRLYTHEIRPSHLNVDRIPTRMGYVARCSKAEAVFKHGQTFLKEGNALVKLQPMTTQTMSDLKDTYYEENVSPNEVTYGKVHFSMNQGDYQKPIY